MCHDRGNFLLSLIWQKYSKCRRDVDRTQKPHREAGHWYASNLNQFIDQVCKDGVLLTKMICYPSFAYCSAVAIPASLAYRFIHLSLQSIYKQVAQRIQLTPIWLLEKQKCKNIKETEIKIILTGLHLAILIMEMQSCKMCQLPRLCAKKKNCT